MQISNNFGFNRVPRFMPLKCDLGIRGPDCDQTLALQITLPANQLTDVWRTPCSLSLTHLTTFAMHEFLNPATVPSLHHIIIIMNWARRKFNWNCGAKQNRKYLIWISTNVCQPNPLAEVSASVRLMYIIFEGLASSESEKKSDLKSVTAIIPLLGYKSRGQCARSWSGRVNSSQSMFWPLVLLCWTHIATSTNSKSTKQITQLEYLIKDRMPNATLPNHHFN